MPVSNFRRYYGPAAVIRRSGFRKGVLGRDRVWLAVWVVFMGVTTLKRQLGRRSQFVSVDFLRPGEVVGIRTIPVSSAKERRRLLRGQN
jgi:hypothetical protein